MIWYDISAHCKTLVQCDQLKVSRDECNTWEHFSHFSTFMSLNKSLVLLLQLIQNDSTSLHLFCSFHYCIRTQKWDIHKIPTFILSDQDSQFVSVFRDLCETWMGTPKVTSVYNPQTNMMKRVNHTLKYMIWSYVEENHKKWDAHLPELMFSINSAVQETTGVSPDELQLDRKLQSPIDKLFH